MGCDGCPANLHLLSWVANNLPYRVGPILRKPGHSQQSGLVR